MSKRILVKASVCLLILSSYFGCGDTVKAPPSPDSVIHVSVRSNPTGAEVYWRIVSTVSEVKSTNRFYLGVTPYRGTRTLSIVGINNDNISGVSLVLIVRKKGYEEIIERYNLAGVLNDLEISAKYNLLRKR